MMERCKGKWKRYVAKERRRSPYKRNVCAGEEDPNPTLHAKI